MKRFIAILFAAAVALLPGCRKDSPEGKKLIGTQWSSVVVNSHESSSERIVYVLAFEKRSHCTLHQTREVRTKMSDPDETSEYQLSGTFSLDGNTLTAVFDKVAAGGYTGFLPITCAGSCSDDGLMLTLEINGRSLVFSQDMLPE